VTRRRPSHISAKRARSALVMLLSGCTEERLAGFTAAQLAGSTRVPFAEVEELLEAAKKGRLG